MSPFTNSSASRFTIAAMLLVAVTSCSKPQSPASSAPIPQETALEMINQLTQTMMGELTATINAQGPAAALDVCAGHAPVIAADLSAGDYTIRRIGTRLRNIEKNTPTAAERKILESLTPEAPIFQGEIAGRQVFMKGVFIPNEMCLTCHGNAAQIPAEVKTALAQRYPNDKAINYSVGELRGAVVVERKASL